MQQVLWPTTQPVTHTTTLLPAVPAAIGAAAAKGHFQLIEQSPEPFHEQTDCDSSTASQQASPMAALSLEHKNPFF